MATPAQRMTESVFARLGREAAYTPQGGAATTVRLRVAATDPTLEDPFQTPRRGRGVLVKVRVAEVAAPARGDRIALDGRVFEVQAEPWFERPDGLVWVLDCGEV